MEFEQSFRVRYFVQWNCNERFTGLIKVVISTICDCLKFYNFIEYMTSKVILSNNEHTTIQFLPSSDIVSWCFLQLKGSDEISNWCFLKSRAGRFVTIYFLILHSSVHRTLNSVALTANRTTLYQLWSNFEKRFFICTYNMHLKCKLIDCMIQWLWSMKCFTVFAQFLSRHTV